MGHSPEQRSQHTLCNARKKDGTRCRAFAGQGTDHPGVGSCKFHGGSTPNGKKRALALEAKQRMVAMSVPVEDAQPHAILLKELTVSAGHVGWLRQEIAGLDPDEIGGERSKVLLTRYDDERERLTRIAKACSDAGVDEAMIRIEEAKATFLAQAVIQAARDAGIPGDYINAGLRPPAAPRPRRRRRRDRRSRRGACRRSPPTYPLHRSPAHREGSPALRRTRPRRRTRHHRRPPGHLEPRRTTDLAGDPPDA